MPWRRRPCLASHLSTPHLALALTPLHRSFLHCGALVPCLEFCCAQLLGGDLRSSQPRQLFAAQCLLFVHQVQRSPSYRGSAQALSLSSGARQQLDTLKALAGEARPALDAFWGGGRLQAVVTALIQRLFPLTDKELDEW